MIKHLEMPVQAGQFTGLSYGPEDLTENDVVVITAPGRFVAIAETDDDAVLDAHGITEEKNQTGILVMTRGKEWRERRGL